jgi:hypothetical protein
LKEIISKAILFMILFATAGADLEALGAFLPSNLPRHKKEPAENGGPFEISIK